MDPNNPNRYEVNDNDPRADHDDGEVRCACCKAILTLDSRGVLDHTCLST